jgi:hypothetical protein
MNRAKTRPKSSWELRAERAEAQRDELLLALATYGKHKAGCASGWRAATGSSQIGPCDCGFAAAIAKVEGDEKRLGTDEGQEPRLHFAPDPDEDRD